MVAPSLVLTDCTVLTQDPDQPEAEAVAFTSGRVLDVGPARRVEGRAGPNTRVLQLEGATVVPGFVDCHTHAARLGELHFRQDLSLADTKDEALQLLAQRAARTPEGGWVIGWNWDESTWPDHAPLTPHDLDAVSTSHNVLARRVCGHKAVLNRAALEAADIPPGTPGLVLERGARTGQLTEDAVDAVWEACAPTFETCRKGLAIETRRLVTLGITAIADTAGPRDIALLTRGAADGSFLQRSSLYVREELFDHVEALSLGPLPGERCALRGAKTYTDGSIGARTAALSEAYADADTQGMALRSADQVASLAARVDALGLQLKAHAIGDAAIDHVLDGLAKAEVPPARRPRLEHAELLRRDQLERMVEGGVVASLQPNFIGNWQGPGGLYEQALGKGRTLAMNPCRSVLDAGVALAFSSDGMPYGPLYGMASAVAHPNPKERITPDEALTAYTRGAAYALGTEEVQGVLRPGAWGDAVVLGEDPRRATDIASIEVRGTVIDGRLVHG